MSASHLVAALGGEWKGAAGHAPCPVCQPERRRDQRALSVRDEGGILLIFCHKSRCDFRSIRDAAGVLGFVKQDDVAREEAEAKRRAYEDAQAFKARRLWEQSRPIGGTKAERYLRGRGISCPLPSSLRFLPDALHGPTGSWFPAMIAEVRPTGGIHRTFLKRDGGRIQKNAKMMLGPCSGGAVHLAASDVGPLVVCEGIETGLSLLSGVQSGPASVWAALSTSGMKALALPERAGSLVVAGDGDEAGLAAAMALAERADALGWRVELLPAPEGRDWNDVLQERVAA